MYLSSSHSATIVWHLEVNESINLNLWQGNMHASEDIIYI